MDTTLYWIDTESHICALSLSHTHQPSLPLLSPSFSLLPQFLKYVNFRENYSLEFAMWFLFAFGPYFLAEGLQLSGIMAVLFCGIVMSHYTHYNLTPVTQVTVQQTMRTVSFLAGIGTCVVTIVTQMYVTTFTRLTLLSCGDCHST